MSDHYVSPFSKRYASESMLKLFSPKFKYETWRKLWYALSKAQKSLGLDISQSALDDMKDHITDINFERVEIFEKETQHEVVAHIKAFGEAAPQAKKHIHLGATSSYVMDNGDLIQMRSGLTLISLEILEIIDILKPLCDRYKSIPCLGFTHLQPAQPTTVGKKTVTMAIRSIPGL